MYCRLIILLQFVYSLLYSWLPVNTTVKIGSTVWHSKMNNLESVRPATYCIGQPGWGHHQMLSSSPHSFSQASRAGNSLIRSSFIHSFAHFAQIKWGTVRDSLRSLKTNERPWANRSGRSEEMSKREWIAQVPQDKWATVSNSLRSLMINEQMSDSLKKF